MDKDIFNDVLFAVTREDHRIEKQIIKEHKVTKMLTICSGGCVPLSLKSLFPQLYVKAIDINQYQIEHVKKKTQAIIESDLSALNIRNLDNSCLNQSGKFEKMFQSLRKKFNDMVAKGNEIDSVVLGRVITLIRNHVPLEKPHLWVVYPRCRNNQNLHLQITGIWEPSTLKKDLVESEELNEASSFKVDSDDLSEGDDYFSIRGELIFTKPEEKEVVIKIRQKPRNQQKKALPFKVNLKGEVPINYLKHFTF